MTVTIENTYTGNGSTTNYSFTFPYLDEPDIKASLDGVVTTNFRLLNATTVQFVNNTTANTPTAPGNGVAIRIYRETAYENPKATFYPGAAIRAGDLNDNTLQNLYVTQEANDKVADAWLRGDETIISSESWHTSDDTKVASTKAIENRINSQIDTALTGDVVAGSSITIADNTPSAGKITVSVDAASGSATGSMSSSDFTKLQGIESNATADQTNAEIRAAVEAASDSNVFTDADHTKLNGIEASATADQTDAEIKTAYENNSDTNAYTDAEKTKLSGIEASATADQTDAEIRAAVEAASDSNVFTDADHTKLNSCESNSKDDQTAAEIKTLYESNSDTNEFSDAEQSKLAAIEANATADQTAAEIKTAYESNAQTNPLTDAEKAVIDGVTANTSELNKLDGVTATTTNLNIVSGKTFRASGDGTLSTTSDTEIPSSKVIATHVASAITNVGGFVTIANEVSFPTTANQPANGVIVSISDAAGTVINGSGVSTTGRTTDGTPATVTINNFPSSLNSETLASGVALLVTSTGSSNTYNYHKILAAETDVKQLSDDINDFNARYRVASSAPGSNNDDGDLWFDTSANKMKVYNATGSSWDDVASVGQFFINTISSSSGTGGGSATFNGSAYRFTLSNPATGGAQQLLVSVNGVLQKPNTGTSQPSEGFAIDGNDIIFSTAPASGSDYFIITQGSSVSIGTPSANSVNSSHIIDGSIVNADISNSAAIAKSKLAALDIVNADVNASAAIASSKIAGLAASATTDTTNASNIASGTLPAARVGDDSIVEGKLDIHNAPATDKYLKYTSNGMEWSDGASEGTDVKSTGEGTSTKYLGTDGDGTCSWKETSFVRTDNASTSTGQLNLTMSGAFPLVINNNNNAKIDLAGSDNPYIQFKEGSTNKSEVAWSTDGYLKLNNSEDGSQLRIQDDLKFSVDGSTFHSVLTSNSTLDSTKLSPAISAAPEIEAVATGSIAANTAVHVKSDGTVQTAVVTAPTYGSLGTVSNGEDDMPWSLVYNAKTNTLLVVFKDAGTGRPTAMAGTISGSTISWGAETELMNGNDYDVEGGLTVEIDPSDDSYVMTYHANSGGNYTRWQIFTVADTTITNDGSAMGTVDTANNEKGHMVCTGPNTFVITYNDGPGQKARKGSRSGNSISWSGETTLYSNDYANHSYLSGPGRLVLPYSSSGLQIKLLDVGAMSVSSAVEIDTSNANDIASAACGANNVIVAYRRDSSSYNLYVIAGYMADGDSSVTWGTAVDVGVACDDPQVHYNSSTGNAVVSYAKVVGGSPNGRYTRDISFSGTNNTTCTAGSETTLYYSSSSSTANTSGSKRTSVHCSESGQDVFLFRISNTGTRYKARTAEQSTMNDENFIGFSNGTSYTNGQTATINVVGNTTTQSSLTPGRKYYLNNDGTIGLTKKAITTPAGIALSSTKLLIKG